MNSLLHLVGLCNQILYWNLFTLSVISNSEPPMKMKNYKNWHLSFSNNETMLQNISLIAPLKMLEGDGCMFMTKTICKVNEQKKTIKLLSYCIKSMENSGKEFLNTFLAAHLQQLKIDFIFP